MNHKLLPSFLLTLLLLTSSLLHAATPVPKAPSVGAKGYLVEDFHSGQTIAEKNADQRLEPASITKLMSAYVIFSEIRNGTLALEDKVRISKKAWRTEGSRMFVEVNTQVSVADLLKGMIIQSGNDATVALAEQVAGTEEGFASLMNHYAQKLGLRNSHFVNSTGLPHKDHYTTARDIARIARALIAEFPEYYQWYSERSFTYNGITQYNRNKLLWRDESVDGLKTGHTDSAGYCLVTSAERDGMRLISVVLGTKSEEARADASQALLNYGFRFFETHKLYDSGSKLASTRVWKGTVDTVDLGLTDTLYVTVPRGEYKNLDASIQLQEQIIAPVSKGQVLGRVVIRLGDQAITEKDLTALNDVAEGNFWQRIVDEALLYFE
ncbi:penicillin-binding protein 6 [Thiogranum longum]|uniref:serine-type D-Ala-D-Ala carboxypeptidase n=1 Tax=Thiogranum longum TaxID=1537524 RepID=A0A4R1HG59_9GAMM|nr:D-alanyl-D-alanine carboxypeptidase family protein [Thiogranum longum]TCK19240.1 penicillin-binding protein 6 [Thiogranum longum]